VPQSMLSFVESAGLAAVAYGPEAPVPRDEESVGDLSKTKNPASVMRELVEQVAHVWAEMGTTLTSLANGAHLLLAGMTEQGLAANVAEYHGIPLAALHFFPAQVLTL